MVSDTAKIAAILHGYVTNKSEDHKGIEDEDDEDDDIADDDEDE